MRLLLAESLQDSGLTAAKWRVRALARWADVRASDHYHDGVPCKLWPECREYDPKAAAEAAGEAA